MKQWMVFSAAATILLACCSTALAATKKVTRKSGAPLIGDVTVKDDVYEVRTRTGLIKVPADEVVSVTDYVSFEEEYARRLLEIKAGDAGGHYKLALWCRQQGKLSQARDELRTVLKLEPKHENAKILLQLIDEELAEKAEPKRPRPGVKAAPVPAMAKELVGEEDIMRVRLAELRSTDNVAIRFRNRADREFIERMRGTGPFAEPGYEREFLRKSPVAKAVDMLDLLPSATDLHADIEVRSNPRFMSTFRTRIWPIVARNCATSQCHGSAKGAGRLKLYNLRIKNDALFFTNFLILDAFENAQGRMIDRAHPPKSLLLQYGLPQDISATPHPVVNVPLYRNNTNDRRYRQVLDWIRNDLLRPHPTYDIEYKIPGATPRRKTLFEPGPEGEAANPAAPAAPATPVPTAAPATN